MQPSYYGHFFRPYPPWRIPHCSSFRKGDNTTPTTPVVNCTEQYIGESGRSLEDRYKEHLKAPSPIHQHTSTTGHPVSPDCFTIVDREAMYIKVNDPSLNRNLGKFLLPPVWDQVLKDTPSLQLK